MKIPKVNFEYQTNFKSVKNLLKTIKFALFKGLFSSSKKLSVADK